MNMPALANKPHVQALANEIGSMFNIENRFGDFEQRLARVCEEAKVTALREAQAALAQAGANAPHKEPCKCKNPGKCMGECDPCKDGACKVVPVSFVDSWSQIVAGLRMNQCRICCRPLSPCMVLALQWMLTRVSDRRLYKILELDDDSVEINTFIGDTTDFVDITTTPLAANKKTLLIQSPTQLAPFIPGMSKAATLWEGDPADAGVTLTLYQGPKGLANLKLADLKGFAQVGNPKNLERWFCKDRCFVRPFPPFLGCSGGIIPDTEAVYLLIETDVSLGTSKLKRLPFEILKAGTFASKKWAGDCGVGCDTWGVPMEDIG